MSDRTMEVLPLPRCCPTPRGLRLGTPIPNKCTLQVLSGLASLTPQWFCDLWAAAQVGDLARAQKLNDYIYPMIRVIYGAPPLLNMHTRIKVALRHLGIITADVPRPPLLPIERDEAEQICRVVDGAGLAGAVLCR
jgi:4-hydroxy-tetrahydrodipicolinate synthase